MENISFFYLKIFLFLVVKFSIYLNRCVFVMKFKVTYYTDETGHVNYLKRSKKKQKMSKRNRRNRKCQLSKIGQNVSSSRQFTIQMKQDRSTIQNVSTSRYLIIQMKQDMSTIQSRSNCVKFKVTYHIEELGHVHCPR